MKRETTSKFNFKENFNFFVMLTMILLSLFCIIETMFIGNIGSKLPYHAI